MITIDELKTAVLHAACVCNGDVTLATINAVTGQCHVDRPWIVAACWELVEDGYMDYGADAVFHVTH